MTSRLCDNMTTDASPARLDARRAHRAHRLVERKAQAMLDPAAEILLKGKKAEIDREAERLRLQEMVSQRRLWNHEAEKHTQHLCYLAEHRQMADLAALVGDGRFICGQCGRVAASPDNLCDPIARG